MGKFHHFWKRIHNFEGLSGAVPSNLWTQAPHSSNEYGGHHLALQK